MGLEAIGRYAVVRALGSGGMGHVYLARDPDLDRLIALKVLRTDGASADPEAPARLRSEARALAALNHPGIVTIHEIGSDDERDFIAMEFVQGASLREQLLAADGPLAPDRVLEIAAAVADALVAAHSAGVLHRDIKPDNVMIDGKGVVKVVDFGIASRVGHADIGPRPPPGTIPASSPFAPTLQLELEGADVVTNTAFGTPGYMAPEVITGNGASGGSDVYSFGVMLYETLCGVLPFRGENLMETLGRVIDAEQTHAQVSSVRPDAPAGLATLVDEMLSKSLEGRPSMEDVRARDPARTRGRRRARSSRDASRAALGQARTTFVDRRCGGARRRRLRVESTSAQDTSHRKESPRHDSRRLKATSPASATPLPAARASPERSLRFSQRPGSSKPSPNLRMTTCGVRWQVAARLSS